MWQIFLQILAVIGIVLLVLLGLVFFLACLILFIPVRYRLDGEIDTKEKKYLGTGKATWLLGILTVKGGYPQPGNIVIKILGYPFKTISFDPEEESEDMQGAEDVPLTFETQSESEKEEKSFHADGTNEILQTDDIQTESKARQSDEIKQADVKQDAPVSSKWYHKIVNTIQKNYDKIKEIWNTIQYYKDVLDEKQTRLFIDRSKKRLVKLLKAIAPKRLKGLLRVGTGSPDTTGYLLGVYGMMVPYLDKHFALEPDFEEAVCSGKVAAVGRIYLWTVLSVILSFTTDKQLSILLKKLKREEQ